MLAGLLELVVLVLELDLEVGDDLVLVGAREMLVLAAVADLEELLAGIDDGLLQILHLLLELCVLRSRVGELAGEPLDLFVEVVDLRDVVLAEATDGIGVEGPEAMVMRGGRGGAANRRALGRRGVSTISQTRSEAAELLECGVRRIGPDESRGDDERADRGGTRVASHATEGPRAAPALLERLQEGTARGVIIG